jgi:hypothetical protein
MIWSVLKCVFLAWNRTVDKDSPTTKTARPTTLRPRQDYSKAEQGDKVGPTRLGATVNRNGTYNLTKLTVDGCALWFVKMSFCGKLFRGDHLGESQLMVGGE